MFSEDLKKFVVVRDLSDGTAKAEICFGTWGRITICSGYHLDKTMEYIEEFLGDVTLMLSGDLAKC